MTTPLKQSEIELRPIPMINGLDCPACGHPCLMLADGGYITCSYIDCPNPDYAEATQALIDTACVEARIDENEGWLKGVAGRYPLLADAIPRRIKELKEGLDG